MEPLNIEMTTKTPMVRFSRDERLLEFRGRSIPENSSEFYSPIFEWIDRYAESPEAATEVNIQLEYFNTSSSKCLLDIFKKLQRIHQEGKSLVKVNWFFEEDDEDMMEAGEDYKAIVKLPFTLNKV